LFLSDLDLDREGDELSFLFFLRIYPEEKPLDDEATGALSPLRINLSSILNQQMKFMKHIFKDFWVFFHQTKS